MASGALQSAGDNDHTPLGKMTAMVSAPLQSRQGQAAYLFAEFVQGTIAKYLRGIQRLAKNIFNNMFNILQRPIQITRLDKTFYFTSKTVIFR
ncbi:hypothetical protein D3C78_1316270 [compost metagenome]